MMKDFFVINVLSYQTKENFSLLAEKLVSTKREGGRYGKREGEREERDGVVERGWK